MVLAHRERTTPKPTQRELAARRLASGQLAPDPRPGVYALHDAADRRPCCRTAAPSGARSARCCRRVRRSKHHRRSARRTDAAITAESGEREPAVRAGRRARLVSPTHYLMLSVLLFTIGGVGVLVRRNAIVVFMCVELMLNACNLAFVTFARMNGNLDGQVIAFFVMVVAAAEVVVGLAIIDGHLPDPQVRVGRRRQPAEVLSEGMTTLTADRRRAVTLLAARDHRPASGALRYLAADRVPAVRRRGAAARRPAHRPVGAPARRRDAGRVVRLRRDRVLRAARGQPNRSQDQHLYTWIPVAASRSTSACWSTRCRSASCC